MQRRNVSLRMMLGMSDPVTQALSSVALFARCSKKELEFIASRADEVDVAAGRQLVRQGRSGDAFFVLLEGDCDVEIDGKVRATLKPGDFFGEISMLDRGPAMATVATRTPSRLMVMSHAQFRDAIKASEPLLTKVMAAMGARLRADELAGGTPRT